MYKKLFIGSLLILLVNQSVIAKPTTQYEVAKKNFENSCVRGIAKPALLKNKVNNHKFIVKYTLDDFPILYGFEKAQLNDGQSIQLKNVGCESYGFDIQLTLNSNKIEKNNQLCQSCLIQELKKLSIYFRPDDRAFYLQGVEIVEQHFAKHKQFKNNQEYQLKGTDEMPHTFTFHQLFKQKNGQYLVSFLNSVGPL